MVFENATYNISKLTQAEHLGDIVVAANDYSTGTLFGFFIIAFFFVSLLVLKRWEFAEALVVSSFVSFILGSIAAYAGYINLIYPLVFLVITAFTIFYIVVSQK